MDELLCDLIRKANLNLINCEMKPTNYQSIYRRSQCLLIFIYYIDCVVFTRDEGVKFECSPF